MLQKPKRREIDQRTMKLIVGVISLTLAGLTWWFAGKDIASISASYWEGGWSQSFFVGYLFAVAAFLLAYNGFSTPEMILSKVAAVAALGVALFPCGCKGHPKIDMHGPGAFSIAPTVHVLSAAVMFGILAYFCYGFLYRARAKHPEGTEGRAQAQTRAVIYAVCGIAIVVAIVALALHGISHGDSSDRFTFFGEATALVAFGVSWLTASRTVPVITHPKERFSPLRADEDNPPD